MTNAPARHHAPGRAAGAGHPRLHPHAHAVHAGLAQEGGLAGGDRGRVHLDGEFHDVGQIKVAPQSLEQSFELEHGEGGWRAAADEDRPWRGAVSEKFRFADDRIDQGVGFSRACNVLVEAAIRADLQAERNVDVEMLQRTPGLFRVVLHPLQARIASMAVRRSSSVMPSATNASPRRGLTTKWIFPCRNFLSCFAAARRPSVVRSSGSSKGRP